MELLVVGAFMMALIIWLLSSNREQYDRILDENLAMRNEIAEMRKETKVLRVLAGKRRFDLLMVRDEPWEE